MVLRHSGLGEKVKVTESKVILDYKKGSDSGDSKCYGFVSFAVGEDALRCLRSMNNNPAVFGKNSRPMVEFAIENKKALNARAKRMEKSRTSNPLYKKKDDTETKDKSKGKSKGKSKKKMPNVGKKEEVEGTEVEKSDKPDFMGSANNPKQRKMPSHMGAKVRHKPR